MKTSVEDTDTFKDQIKTGKLDVSDLYPNDHKEDIVKGEMKIGKIKTKVGSMNMLYGIESNIFLSTVFA